MAAFTSNIDITSGGTYNMDITNGEPASQVATDLNGKFANIQRYLQNGLPEVWTGDSLPDSLPDGKLVLWKNKLYGNLNNVTSELNPAQLYTFSKTQHSDRQTLTTDYSSTSYDIMLSLPFNIPNPYLFVQLTPISVYVSCSRGGDYENMKASAEITYQRISGAEYTTETFGSCAITTPNVTTLNCTPRSTLCPLYLKFPNNSQYHYVLYPFLCAKDSQVIDIEFSAYTKISSGTTFTAQCQYRIDALCYNIA